jgi:Flagellar basal body rod FlgEFG protein C-terminal
MMPLSLTNAASDPTAALGSRASLPLPPERTASDPTETTSSSLESQNDEFVRTSVVKRAEAIEGPRPVEIEPGPAMDESIWKFILDTPPTETTETTEAQPSGPESSEASGWKSSRGPVAHPALPEVHPAEKFVDGSSVETPSGASQTGAGALVDAVLEQPNVDIARQFTQLILALRAYRANSEGTVSNELLADTLNIKR